MMDKQKPAPEAKPLPPQQEGAQNGDEIVMVQARVSRAVQKRLKLWLIDHPKTTQEQAIGMALTQFMDKVAPEPPDGSR